MIKPNGEQSHQPQALAENQNGEARGDKTEVYDHADGGQLEQTGRSGTEDGLEQIGSVGDHDPPPHPQRRKISTREVLGKILSRVDELEAKYLAYVESHRQRLAQRLSESETNKEEALQLVAEIREMTALLDKQLEEEGEE